MGDTVKPFDFRILQSGDCLLYRPSGFFGWLIAVKTWNKISHVEICASGMVAATDMPHRSYASRDGIGVGCFPLRTAQLARVLRPIGALNLTAAHRWFWSQANGQKYDWLGLLVFTLAVKQGAKNKMFCSEFATRWYRAAGLEPFAPDYDADRVAPATFLASPMFQTIWRDDA